MSAGTTAIDISDEASTQMLGGGVLTDKPAAILRGTARGLEIVIEAPAGLDAIIDTIDARLAEAPTFFKGSNVRVQVNDGPLPVGSLGLLEDLAQQYDLRIVEINAAKPEPRRAVKATEDAIPPAPVLAIGSGAFDDVPTSEGEVYRTDRAEEFGDIPTQILPSPPNSVVMATAMVLAPALGTISLHDALASARTGLAWVPPAKLEAPVVKAEVKVEEAVKAPTPVVKAPTPVAVPEAPELELEPDTRIVVGPVRSGVILDHRGHVIVFGDVNPGAEVRAAGNIVVLGKLKGLAHAGIGADVGFIVALHLQPQQLRIGRMVARSSDDAAAAIPEIAYVTNGSIVVERYTGKLPAGLAASLTS
jgi:septum formation inhibitor MinC